MSKTAICYVTMSFKLEKFPTSSCHVACCAFQDPSFPSVDIDLDKTFPAVTWSFFSDLADAVNFGKINDILEPSTTQW